MDSEHFNTKTKNFTSTFFFTGKARICGNPLMADGSPASRGTPETLKTRDAIATERQKQQKF
jgi:hypothetical protein